MNCVKSGLFCHWLWRTWITPSVWTTKHVLPPGAGKMTSCNFDEPTPHMIKESAFYFWCWYSKLCFVCSRQHLVLILIHLCVALFHWASVPDLRGRHTTSTDSGRWFRRGRTKNPDWITMRFSACFIQLLSWLCCIQMRCWRSAKTIMCHFMFYSLKKAQTGIFFPFYLSCNCSNWKSHKVLKILYYPIILTYSVLMTGCS